MKKWKRILAWAMLSIILQISGLVLLDKVVFAHSSDFKIEKVEAKKKPAEINVQIPSNAKEVRSSFDGKFITYVENDKLQIVNTQTSDKKELITEGNGQIMNYEWLPDRNRIIVAENIKNNNGSSVIKLITYDAKTGTESEVKEICPYQNDMEVDSITASVLTGVYYVSVSRGGYNSTIYRIDINHTLTKLNNKVPALGNMKVLPHKDILVYEDKINKSFYKYQSGVAKKLNFTNSQNLSLITIDNNDIVYMGELEGSKIKRIIYGKIDEDISTWKTQELEKAKDVKDISINNKSEILINDNLEGKVTNLSTGDTITYDGKLIEITSKVISSESNGKLFMKSVTEIDKVEDMKE